MPYFDIVWRSFRIAWNHKYLWLLALFAGEGGGGFGSGGGGGGGGGNGQRTPNATEVQAQITTWISDHTGLIVLLVIVWLVLVVAFFILAAICQGAAVRAAAEHDADRPFGLGLAWRVGLGTMWVIVRFRLLIVALGLPLLLLVIGVAAGVFLAAVNNNGGAVIGFVVLGVLLALIAIPYLIYISFLDRYGSRAVVLEQIGATAAVARAHRLLFKRLGRSLIVWLLSIAVGIVLGILTACASAIVFVPLFLIGTAIYAANQAAIVPLILVGIVIALPLFLLLGGFLAAQASTYWTLAFRRLDLDPQPAALVYPQAPPAPPATG